MSCVCQCRRPIGIAVTALLEVAVMASGGIPAQAQSPAPAHNQTHIIENVMLIDGRGGDPLRDAVVVVENGRILAAGRRGDVPLPAGARRTDGRGGYLLPGFIDTHAHVTLGPVRMDLAGPVPSMSVEPDADGSRRSLALLLASGITSARDPGGPVARTVALRDSIAHGQLIGPRLRVAGEVIDVTAFEGLTASVTTPDQVRVEVRRQAAAGVDLIKLYATLGPELVRAGVEEAHAAGLPAVAHLMMTTWTEAAGMGLDGIVHILGWSPKMLPAEARASYLAMMTGTQFMYGWLELVDLEAPEIRDAVAALAQNGMNLDPTLVVFERAVRGDDPAVIASPHLADASPELLENWRTAFTFNLGWSAEDYTRARAAWPKALRFTKMLYDAGVLLSAGTDANNPWVVPGESWHRELELLVEAGIPPADVIGIATRNGARVLGMLEETGTVEQGKRADLVLLRENPLVSISATRTIEWVMKDGVTWRPAELRAQLKH